MMTFWFLTAPIRCAFYYRWRGMAHSWSDTVNRLMYAAALGFECAMVALSWNLPLWLSPFCAVGAFAGACIGHASAQGDSLDDYFSMMNIISIMNGLLLLPFFIYLSFYKTENAFIWGATLLFAWLTPFACWLGYRMDRPLYSVIWRKHIEWCLPGDSSWEEFYIGLLPFGLLFAFLGISGVLTH